MQLLRAEYGWDKERGAVPIKPDWLNKELESLNILSTNAGHGMAGESLPEFRCFHCDQPAVWDGQFWRHDVSTQDKLDAAAFCNKYGYPIPVRDADGKVRQANDRSVVPCE